MASILVTGFDPFGGETLNPASQLLKKLDPKQGIEVITQEIPTIFGVSAKAVQDAVEKFKPTAAICVGQAGGSASIRVERVALNLDDAAQSDNAGNRPADAPIVPEGPVAYWATIPVRQTVEAIRRKGIPADISYSAGTFVCNHVFYSICHFVAVGNLPTKVGFIHVPYLPRQVVGKASVPSMSEDCMVKALETVIEVAGLTSQGLVLS